MKKIKGLSVFDIFLYTILCFITFITIYPFINVIALSFNDSVDAFAGGIYFLPRKFTLKNYEVVFSNANLILAMKNTVVRTVIGTVFSVMSTTMMAFAISRRDFIARKLYTKLFAITMYVSGGLIPVFVLMQQLHLRGTFWVYIFPYLIWPFCLFIIRSFIDGLPMSLQESAMLDGANDIVIFFRVILPLCKPVLATVALYYAVFQWNSWFDVFLYNPYKLELTTLQYELQKMLQSASTAMAQGAKSINTEYLKNANVVTPQALQMAITVVATLPIIFVYPFVQRYFISGMTLGAVKG